MCVEKHAAFTNFKTTQVRVATCRENVQKETAFRLAFFMYMQCMCGGGGNIACAQGSSSSTAKNLLRFAKNDKNTSCHKPAHRLPPNHNESNPAPPSHGECPTAEFLPSSKIAFIA